MGTKNNEISIGFFFSVGMQVVNMCPDAFSLHLLFNLFTWLAVTELPHKILWWHLSFQSHCQVSEYILKPDGCFDNEILMFTTFIQITLLLVLPACSGLKFLHMFSCIFSCLTDHGKICKKETA